LKWCLSTGVFPFGAQVDLTEGRSENPASSWKQIQAFRRRAFFYPRPVLGHPGSDRLVVALDGTTRRPLAAPAHLVEDFPDMAGMVGNPRGCLDHLGHPLKRPEISGISMGERALAQLGLEIFELALVELRHPSRPTGGR
jgi:hypothetical protein